VTVQQRVQRAMVGLSAALVALASLIGMAMGWW
jgi:hypothetical protein